MVLANVFGFPSTTGLARFLTPATQPILQLPCAKVTSCLTLVLLICFETVLLSTVSDCTKSFYVHWNTTNPIFRIDNTDHIIDVNKGNIPFEYDQVNIICPVYTPGTHEEDAEKYIIYNVSKEEYDTCRITNPNPRIIAICDKPYKLMYFTITFRSFTPQPGGLEFQPGQDYYFISTSSKDDLHRRVGGRCSSNNMKVVFKVCCRPQTNVNQSLSENGLSTPGLMSSIAPVASMRPPSQQRPQTTAHPPPPSQPPPLPPHQVKPTTSFVKPTTKKTNDNDKIQNEVVKNEELTYNRAQAQTHSVANYLLTACITWLLRLR
ncbi:hypothetical protein LSTR_LSTR006713 [Laodelphax striatellus]|uniref:Ephrin RBD domain-containing protein n=1 Tax=Laodelphax striatellus TaxID=195883 RepID=A0A482X9F7_LAOST|nr:hypothetical protein LSTR_LSTR006713 [Laodelphax striatellus]